MKACKKLQNMSGISKNMPNLENIHNQTNTEKYVSIQLQESDLDEYRSVGNRSFGNTTAGCLVTLKGHLVTFFRSFGNYFLGCFSQEKFSN